jgi:N-acetyltransferase 10
LLLKYYEGQLIDMDNI